MSYRYKLLLHLTFIFLLFRDQRKAKKYLSIGLISLVLILIGISLLGKVLEINAIYRTFNYAFKQLFGLPFILLAIEGGRILYNDINRLSDNKK